MQNAKKIDYAKLLGFDTISDEIVGSVDFQADTIGARLGAKVGEHVPAPLDYSKLVGFATLSDEFVGGVDFQADAVSSKLGAKVGGVEED